jgi:hypothetical protein
MFKNIPQTRLLAYILVAGLIPFILVVFNFMNKLSSINSIENTEQLIDMIGANLEKKQALNIAVRNNYLDADHFYIDKNLENLQFLTPEIEGLEKVMTNKNFPDDENIKKRLEFLQSGGNTLVFSEGVVQSNPFFQEVLETLVHPVEVDADDIREILAKIEGQQIRNYAPGPNRPQLIILEFKFDKKQLSEKNEIYLLNMKLLKREFVQ